MKSFITLTVAAFTLASCGGGGAPGPTTVGPTSLGVGILPSGFDASLDVATDEVVFTVDGVEMARMSNTGDIGQFGFYDNAVEYALFGQTNSGDGSVLVASSPSLGLDVAGVQVNRLGDTILPSSGSATFNGQYEGNIVNNVFSFISVSYGNAQLIANFENSSISGAITDRIVGGGFTADDIQLLPTAITSAGAFSGTTTGGNIIGETTANNGEYVGLIVGATGNEVVGGLSITHLVGLGTSLEIGGFVAAE